MKDIEYFKREMKKYPRVCYCEDLMKLLEAKSDSKPLEDAFKYGWEMGYISGCGESSGGSSTINEDLKLYKRGSSGLLKKYPCQQLLGGTGAAIYSNEEGLCNHPECNPENDDRENGQDEPTITDIQELRRTLKLCGISTPPSDEFMGINFLKYHRQLIQATNKIIKRLA